MKPSPPGTPAQWLARLGGQGHHRAGGAGGPRELDEPGRLHRGSSASSTALSSVPRSSSASSSPSERGSIRPAGSPQSSASSSSGPGLMASHGLRGHPSGSGRGSPSAAPPSTSAPDAPSGGGRGGAGAEPPLRHRVARALRARPVLAGCAAGAAVLAVLAGRAEGASGFLYTSAAASPAYRCRQELLPFLKGAGGERYLAIFHDQGFHCMEDVLALDEQDLIESIGIKAKSDRKRMLGHIQHERVRSRMVFQRVTTAAIIIVYAMLVPVAVGATTALMLDASLRRKVVSFYFLVVCIAFVRGRKALGYKQKRRSEMRPSRAAQGLRGEVQEDSVDSMTELVDREKSRREDYMIQFREGEGYAAASSRLARILGRRGSNASLDSGAVREPKQRFGKGGCCAVM